MAASPLEDSAEQQLPSIVHKATLQNTALLIKSASCSPGSPPHLRAVHGDHRFPLLAALLESFLHANYQKLNDSGVKKRLVIAVQGRKDLNTTAALIKERFEGDAAVQLTGGDKLVHGLQGHADIVEFSRLWRDAFSQHRILLTSAQSLLFLFCHGLLKMDQLSHLVFDDCTMANANHPYCTIMKSFYLPQRAKLLKQALDDDDDDDVVNVDEVDCIAAQVPRIIVFADWPLVREGENFLIKRDRIAKMLQYLRMFQCVIRPLTSELKAPEGFDWLSYNELVYLKDAGCFEQLTTIYLEPGKETLKDRMECVAERFMEMPAGQANVLVLVKEDSLQMAERLLTRDFALPCELLTTTSMGMAQGSVLLFSTADENLHLLAYYLQQQSPETLSTVFLAEPCIALYLLTTLMAYATQMPICSIRSTSRESLQAQAVEMALWMAAIGASSPVDSVPFRKLRAFVGGYEALAKLAYLLADSSPVHHLIPASGALINTATSITMLLCCCSYLPHIESAGTGLRIHTMAVKRATADGQELDKDRHYYITRISLPPCLQPLIGNDDALMHIRGPMTPSRFSSQTLAANAALKLLHDHRILDDNLIISSAVLESLSASSKEKDGASSMKPEMVDEYDPLRQTTHHQLQYNPFEDEDIGDVEAATQTQELVPTPFHEGTSRISIIYGQRPRVELRPMKGKITSALGSSNLTVKSLRTGPRTSPKSIPTAYGAAISILLDRSPRRFAVRNGRRPLRNPTAFLA